MHTLHELEMICQKPHWRERGSLLARRFARPAALYVTWLIHRWPVSANLITGIALVTGWSAAALLATPGYFVGGVVALWIWYLLDHVDGQLARLRKTQSVTGVYFDFMMHHLVHPAIAFALGYGLALSAEDLRWSLAGASFAFGTMALSLTNDCRYKAFFKAARSDAGWALSAGIEKDRIDGTPESPADGAMPKLFAIRLSGFARAVHTLLLRACEIPNVTLFLTMIALCAVADADIGGIAVGVYTLVMAILAPVLAVLRLMKQVWNHLPDRDFRTTFSAQDAAR